MILFDHKKSKGDDTMSVKTKSWFRAAGIRALRTVAQTAVASIGTAATIGAVDWRLVTSASLLAGLLSLLMSIKGLPELTDQ